MSPRLQRKDRINPDERTTGRDEAADAIEQLQRDGLPVAQMNKSDIADRIGWSRSHTQSVLKHYFERVSDAANGNGHATNGGHEYRISVPDGVDEVSYIAGYVRGQRQTA